MKRLRIFLFILALPVILFGVFLIVSMLVRFNPQPIETLATLTPFFVNRTDTLKFFNWNVGYCGLGDDMDFFYDGGLKMRTSYDRTLQNIDAVVAQIKSENACQFFLLQEVDICSKRSFKTNQMQAVLNQMPGYQGFLAYNYKAWFVPIPLKNPLGKIHSGLVTLSNINPSDVKRINFGSEAAWPKSLFMMQRCFMVLRYPVDNGKELIIINTHKSAYDNGEHRRHQMAMFKEFLLSEYAKGNYIIAGGDWNQNPPIDGKQAGESKEGHLTRIRIDDDYMPADWTWAFDPQTPSNRMINEVYNPITTVTTIIDFYLLSPNVELVNVKTKDLRFKNSDHQPVILQAKLKNN